MNAITENLEPRIEAQAERLSRLREEVAKVITKTLTIPVIGIGSGPDCDGQVLVSTDMWGDHEAPFKFLRSFGELKETRTEACRSYAEHVRSRMFPADEHSFHVKKSDLEAWSQRHAP